MEDELKKKIKAIIAEAQEEDHHGNLLVYSDEATDSILSLIAPVLADAELGRKLKPICQEFVERCERGEVRSRYTYRRMKDALDGEEEG